MVPKSGNKARAQNKPKNSGLDVYNDKKGYIDCCDKTIWFRTWCRSFVIISLHDNQGNVCYKVTNKLRIQHINGLVMLYYMVVHD